MSPSSSGTKMRVQSQRMYATRPLKCRCNVSTSSLVSCLVSCMLFALFLLLHVRLPVPCIRCCNLCWNTYQKEEPQKWRVSLRLPFSHPCGLIASDPFTDVSVTGRVVPRLVPDRRPARWWPVTLSKMGWTSLERHPSGTNVNCDKGHTVLTRATATGAEDMAIPLDPLGQGRHQRSRWSRPGSCRSRTALVIPRSTRRTPVEISHP